MTAKTKTNFLILFFLCLTAVLTISACAALGPKSPDGDPVEQAMQTLQAQATQDYYATLISQVNAQATEIAGEAPTAQPNEPTNVVDFPVLTQAPPTETQAPTTATVVQTNTAVPPTQVPTAVFTPTNLPPTATPKPCYQLSFISDVTIPDGTKIVAGTTFTKTWRIQNSGTCKWDTGFDIVFVDGDQMGANKAYDFPKNVAPGETVDISIDFVAPLTSGNYTSKWMLFSNNGVRFGPGAKSDGSIWVKIQSVDGKGVVYSFADSACSAKWSSKSKTSLSCPGDEKNDDNGYVLVKKEPIREDGGKENEPGLVTRPDDSNEGYIQGIYPAFQVRDGDKFRATIQCEGGANGCKLKFEVYVREPGGKFVEIGEWYEVFDKKWQQVEVDLSAFAGKKLEFSLVVWNNGTSVNNRGLWLNPVIYRTK